MDFKDLLCFILLEVKDNTKVLICSISDTVSQNTAGIGYVSSLMSNAWPNAKTTNIENIFIFLMFYFFAIFRWNWCWIWITFDGAIDDWIWQEI